MPQFEFIIISNSCIYYRNSPRIIKSHLEKYIKELLRAYEKSLPNQKLSYFRKTRIRDIADNEKM